MSQTASPSPSTIQEAGRPASPENSLRKSAGGLQGTEAAANRAADQAFVRKSSLPLLSDQPPGVPADWDGRRSLAGAYLIELSRIRPDPLQPRKILDAASVKELADSITKLGVLQPVTVRFLAEENVYQIITGERRFLAAQQTGLKELPCWVQTPEAREILVRQVVENWQRVDLHPFDLADTLMQLRDHQGYTQKQVADLTGKPESEISKLLSLLKLREAIQQQYRRDKTGTLSRRHLENIAKLPLDEQAAFHAHVEDKKLTAKDTEELVQASLERHDDGSRRRGAPRATRKRIVCPKGSVILLLRKKEVLPKDALELLDAAKRHIKTEGL